MIVDPGNEHHHNVDTPLPILADENDINEDSPPY